MKETTMLKEHKTYHLHVAIVGITVFLLFLQNVINAGDVSNTKSNSEEFSLTKGAGTPVCDAYLQRLNSTMYDYPPFCDRLENDQVPGFLALNRVRMTPEKILVIYTQVKGFLSSTDPEQWHKLTETRKKLGLSPWGGTKDQQLQGIISSINTNQLKVFRYDPPIDIDNDGIQDEVVLWKEQRCGTYEGVSPYRQRAPTFAIVLNKNRDQVDTVTTKELFGHPMGGYGGSKQFRPIGDYLGIFNYKGQYYFDTFYTPWGDLANNRREDPNIADTLAVFKHSQGKLQLMCEYLWHNPETMEK